MTSCELSGAFVAGGKSDNLIGFILKLEGVIFWAKALWFKPVKSKSAAPAKTPAPNLKKLRRDKFCIYQHSNLLTVEQYF